MLIFRYKRIL